MIPKIRRNPVSKGLLFLLLCLGVQSVVYAVSPVILRFTGFNSNSLEMEIGKGMAKSDGKDSVKVKVRALDPQGKPLVGVYVHWKVSDSNGNNSYEEVKIVAPKKTDSKGFVAAELRSSVPGKYTVTASMGNVGDVSQSAQIAFSDGHSFNGPMAVPSDQLDVSQAAVLEVKLVKGDEPAPDKVVTWSLSGIDGSIIKQSEVTNKKGVAWAIVKASQVGEMTVTATAINGLLTQTGTVQFKSDYSFESVLGSIEEFDVGKPAKVAVKLLKKGKPVPQGKVKWGVLSAGGSIIKSSQSTDNQGIVRATVTSHQAGDLTVTATAPNGLVWQSKVPFKSNYAFRELVLPVEKIKAGRYVGVSLQLEKDGKPAEPDTKVSWSVQGAGSELSSTTSITDKDGILHNSLKANSSGNVTITATAPNGLTWSKEMKFQDDYRIQFILVPKKGAKVDEFAKVKVQVKKNGEGVQKGVNIDWMILTGDGELESKTVETDDDGVATNSIKAYKPGKIMLMAFAPNGRDIAMIELDFEETDSGETYSFDGKGNVPTGEILVTNNAKVSVKVKKGGQLEKGVKVKWAVSGAGASIDQSTTTTKDQGVTGNIVRATKDGTASVSAILPDGTTWTGEVNFVDKKYSYEHRIVWQ